MLKYGELVNTGVYDTIYAHQNLKDDLKAGVKSVAVACQGRTKLFLSFPSILEVGLLGAVGYLLRMGALYFLKYSDRGSYCSRNYARVGQIK